MSGAINWILMVFLFIVTGSTTAQKFEWLQPINAGEICTSVAIDSDGSYYFVGDVCAESKEQQYFNQTPIPYYPDDFLYSYIVKTDDSLNVDWLKVVQAGGYVGIGRIRIDHEGQLVYSCSFRG